MIFHFNMIEQITDEEIREAKDVLDKHTVKQFTNEHCLESLYFCIASQATPWEKASNFIDVLRNSVNGRDYWSCLTDLNLLSKVAKEARLRFHHQDRFGPSLEYLKSLNRPFEEIFAEVKRADSEIRNKYIKEIKFVEYKTFSFWHLCLGGKNLATIDVHVRRRLAQDFGFNINPDYYKTKKRKSVKEVISVHEGLFGEEIQECLYKYQNVTPQPNGREYIELEEKIRDFFSRDSRFVINNQTDMGLITALLWWRGAKRESSDQRAFDYFDCESKVLPYSK